MALGLLRILVGVGVSAAIAAQRAQAQGPQAPRAVGPPLMIAPPRARVSHTGAVLTALGGTAMIGAGVVAMLGQAFLTSVDRTGDAWLHFALGVGANVFGWVLRGGVLYVLAGWLVWRGRRLSRLQALCDTHGRLPLTTLAEELRTTPEVARALVLDAVERRLVHARLDLEEGMILSGTAASAGRAWAGTCSTCRAAVQVVVAPGQPGVCPYCRHALGVIG